MDDQLTVYWRVSRSGAVLMLIDSFTRFNPLVPKENREAYRPVYLVFNIDEGHWTKS
jgi:hypothetical protein